MTAHFHCRFCGAPCDQSFADLGMSPLANSYVAADDLHRMEKFYPLHARLCTSCLLVQLDEFESPDAIFGDYSYFSSYSESWLAHARAYVDQVADRFALGPSSLVVELASNDGYLLRNFVARGVPVLGIEPAANVAKVAVEAGVPTTVAFFGAALARSMVAEGKQADLIVANNVLAHVPALNDFVAGIKIALKPRGVFTVEVPHLAQMMANNQFDTIYHEHFSYFSFLAVEKVFRHHGLRIFDVQQLSTHGGSLRLFGAHEDDPRGANEAGLAAVKRLEAEMGLDQRATYARFAEQVMATKRAFLRFLIGARDEGKRVVAYGAPAKGNTLLNYCGVRRDLIEFTVDRSPHKQGRFLPGIHIPIVEPAAIDAAKPDYIVVLPWNLEKEIVQQMAHVRAWGGRFVIPIPTVRVVEA